MLQINIGRRKLAPKVVRLVFMRDDRQVPPGNFWTTLLFFCDRHRKSTSETCTQTSHMEKAIFYDAQPILMAALMPGLLH